MPGDRTAGDMARLRPVRRQADQQLFQEVQKLLAFGRRERLQQPLDRAGSRCQHALGRASAPASRMDQDLAAVAETAVALGQPGLDQPVDGPDHAR